MSAGHPAWSDIGLHGTRREYVQSITRTGLDTKWSAGRSGAKREHVHLVPSLRTDGGEQPGVRAGSDAIVHVDLARLHKHQAIIYTSVNGVILTAGFAGNVPPQYISKTESVPDGRVLSGLLQGAILPVFPQPQRDRPLGVRWSAGWRPQPPHPQFCPGARLRLCSWEAEHCVRNQHRMPLRPTLLKHITA